MLSTTEIIAKYGSPGPSNLVVIDLPFTFKINWAKDVVANKMQCHRLVADSLRAILTEILEAYGPEQIDKLQINDFGGCYNFRKMRGGSDWSRHSWGIAIDLDPDRNQLTWGRDKAAFAKPEYRQMIEIFYKHGWIGLGPEENRDWMHFQIGH
jgi:hypothetical protein